ncbi:epoxide hydrolase family protein [Ruegeria sp. SCPT10]|uniref:epoxide hydrolase family protein n=1 Tax=Ruegeria sp. SCP10 TaxID=3141377 RepID=UPI0033395D62
MYTKRNFLTATAFAVAANLVLPFSSSVADTPRIAGGTAEPFTIEVPQDRLDRIMAKVRDHQFLPALPADAAMAPWDQGMSQSWMADMGQIWANDYDWRDAEDRLNAFQNFRAEIDGKDLHFIHEPGSGSNPTPILILHGWPYSPYSFVDVIEQLAHPQRFGGDAEDGYDVVVASIPGVGWSEAPDVPEGLRATGERFHNLMTEVLGYERYVTHGGDQGAITAAYMGIDYPEAAIANHVHMFYPRHAESPWLSGAVGDNPTAAEQAFIEREAASPFTDLAYILTHIARGETLAAALHENPVGQAAWIWDKWFYWTDKSYASIDEVYEPTRLIDEVMYYIVTDSFRTSLWPYLMLAHENVTVLAEGEMVDTPTGVTAWPDPTFPLPPKEYVERSRSNLIHYTNPERGGHFPMVETPELYVEDLLSFHRTLRGLE